MITSVGIVGSMLAIYIQTSLEFLNVFLHAQFQFIVIF
jgi:hypothetical protein